jgi:hypothetical protein
VKIASVRWAPKRGPFDRCLRRLERKFPSVRADVAAAITALTGPEAPPVPSPPSISRIPGLGAVVVMKVRIRSSDMKSGKSAGFRALLVLRNEVTWEWCGLLIYAKVDAENVKPAEILDAIEAERVLEPPEPPQA